MTVWDLELQDHFFLESMNLTLVLELKMMKLRVNSTIVLTLPMIPGHAQNKDYLKEGLA